jgi:hypothetical protein
MAGATNASVTQRTTSKRQQASVHLHTNLERCLQKLQNINSYVGSSEYYELYMAALAKRQQ